VNDAALPLVGHASVRLSTKQNTIQIQARYQFGKIYDYFGLKYFSSHQELMMAWPMCPCHKPGIVPGNTETLFLIRNCF
jgi:hypothetical protein